MKYERPFTLRLTAWTDGENVLFCMGKTGDHTRFHSGFEKLADTIRLRYENSLRMVGYSMIISASLCGALHERVSLYENGESFALVNEKNGALETVEHNRFGTMAVRSRKLAQYIRDKLGSAPLFGLPVDEGVVFSADRQQGGGGLKKYRKVDLDEYSRKREPDRKRNHGRGVKTNRKRGEYLALRHQGTIALKSAEPVLGGPWVSVYEYRNMIAVGDDPFGRFYLYDASNGHHAMTSRELSDYLKHKYGDPDLKRLYLTMKDGVAYVCDKEMRRQSMPSLTMFQKLHFSGKKSFRLK